MEATASLISVRSQPMPIVLGCWSVLQASLLTSSSPRSQLTRSSSTSTRDPSTDFISVRKDPTVQNAPPYQPLIALATDS